MLAEWLERRDTVMRLMNDYRVLCAAPAPDPAALSRGRWLISNASRQRVAWLAIAVHPVAERLADSPGAAAWRAVEHDAPAHRQRISGFLSRWTMEAVIGDWSGYCRSGAELHRDITHSFQAEEQAVRLLAAEMEASATQR